MKPSDAGFSLIEIMVAMTLLALVLMGVARLNFTLAQRFYALSGGGARDAVLAQQVNQFAALPFDSLKAKAGTITVNKPPLPYTGTSWRARPSRPASGWPSSRALRSHRAISTAEMAVAATPGRPMLRTCLAMASAMPAMSKASRPVTRSASISVMTVWAAAEA